jgi:hypothetical protein
MAAERAEAVLTARLRHPFLTLFAVALAAVAVIVE